MKKYYCIILILISLCTNSCYIRKMTPDDVFRKWQLFAIQRKYYKMFKYEYFKYSYVISIYNKIHTKKKWEQISEKEKNQFIDFYKNTLMKLLSKKQDNKYQALLRLKKEYQIKMLSYTIDLLKGKATLRISGDYPDAERIRFIKIKGEWYLINPFGYHNYMPVLKALQAKESFQRQ